MQNYYIQLQQESTHQKTSGICLFRGACIQIELKVGVNEFSRGMEFSQLMNLC